VRLRIGLIGDHDEGVVAHRAIPKAVALAAADAGLEVGVEWLGTDTIDPARPVLSGLQGLWCVPGSPYRSARGAIAAIRFARERDVPFLGTCGGFQHALLECAESLWGVGEAIHAEVDPGSVHPVIAALSCALVEVSGVIHFAPRSRLATAYGRPSAEEEYHCSYGVNLLYRPRLEAGPLRVTAWDEAGDVRGIELDEHTFYVATLFQPERAALRGVTPPLVSAFVEAVAASARVVAPQSPG
jgi:CTP synthase (UTP-ammonia lyase)